MARQEDKMQTLPVPALSPTRPSVVSGSFKVYQELDI